MFVFVLFSGRPNRKTNTHGHRGHQLKLVSRVCKISFLMFCGFQHKVLLLLCQINPKDFLVSRLCKRQRFHDIFLVKTAMEYRKLLLLNPAYLLNISTIPGNVLVEYFGSSRIRIMCSAHSVTSSFPSHMHYFCLFHHCLVQVSRTILKRWSERGYSSLFLNLEEISSVFLCSAGHWLWFYCIKPL